MLPSGPMLGPELVLVESSNVIRRLELVGDITDSVATTTHRNLVRLDVRLYPFTPFADRIWELRNNLTAYDAWYVALAEVSGCPLVTLDLRLSRASGPRCEIATSEGDRYI